MPKIKLNNDGRKSGILFVVIVLTILSTVLAGGVLAKYIMNSDDEPKNTIVAKEFYFTSDMLTEDGESYILSPGDDSTASITFTIGNNADELRFSEDDINYEVSISNGGLIDTTSGTLKAGDTLNSSEDITISGLAKGESYTVTAIGRAGYEKTLTATFNVADDDKVMYKSVSQTNHYVLLTVWTKNVIGYVGIKTPEKLITDETDPSIITNSSSEFPGIPDGIIVDVNSFISAYSSHTYRFFKTTSNVYDADDFDVLLRSSNEADNINQEDVIVATPE